MAQVTFDSPLTLNPQQATKLVIDHAVIDFPNQVINVNIRLVDNNGTTLETRRISLNSAAVKTWIGNQEATLLTSILNKIGATGTIA